MRPTKPSNQPSKPKKTFRAYPSSDFLSILLPIEATFVYTFKGLSVRTIVKKDELTRGVPFVSAYSLCNPSGFDYKTWANDQSFKSLEARVGPPKEHIMWVGLTDSSTGNLIYAKQPYLSKEYALSLSLRINRPTHERLLRILEIIEEDSFNQEIRLLKSELAKREELINLKDQEIEDLNSINKDQKFLIELLSRVNTGLRERLGAKPYTPFNIEEVLNPYYW